ncbi:MAG TPA: hypothetical protein VGI86_13565 [Acidimicrobiia bacterium]|jgi:hypothetical protein
MIPNEVDELTPAFFAEALGRDVTQATVVRDRDNSGLLESILG